MIWRPFKFSCAAKPFQGLVHNLRYINNQFKTSFIILTSVYITVETVCETNSVIIIYSCWSCLFKWLTLNNRKEIIITEYVGNQFKFIFNSLILHELRLRSAPTKLKKFMLITSHESNYIYLIVQFMFVFGSYIKLFNNYVTNHYLF